MFVFDPLAVTLIICFNHILKNKKQKLDYSVERVTTSYTTTTAAPAAPTTTIAPTTTTTVAPEPIKLETEAERLLRIMEEQRQERSSRKGNN